MNELLNKESVKRVEESLKKFDPNLKILVLLIFLPSIRGEQN